MNGARRARFTGVTELSNESARTLVLRLFVQNYKIIGNIAVCGAKGEIETTETESAVTCRDCRFALGELKAKGWS